MSDNERIVKLQNDLVDAVNGCKLPSAVVLMALENVQLKVRLQDAHTATPTAATNGGGAAHE